MKNQPDYGWKHLLVNRLHSAIHNLNELLGITGRSKKNYKGMPLHGIYQRFIERVNADDRRGAEGYAFIVYRLVLDLRILKNEDSSLFASLTHRLKKSSRHNYRGTRFEICAAALLFEKGVKLKSPKRGHSDSPDFVVKYGETIVKIECTAPQLEKEKSDRDLFPKIESKLREKARKTYSDLNTAVMIDITALVYAEGSVPLLSRDLKSAVGRLAEELGLGSVVLFFYGLPEGEPRELARCYDRCDNPGMSSELRAVLENGCPLTHFIKSPVSISFQA